jgi:hypothetical protein
MGRIGRGWALTKKSFALVEHDRRLLLMPMLSIVATIAAAVIIFVPVGAWYAASGGKGPWIVGAVVGIWALNFISVFFGVAFIAVAKRSLDGQSWTLGDGWRAAGSRLHVILMWSLVATAVGLILQALENVRGGQIVQVAVRAVLGAAWSIATFFVIPVLALEGANPVDAMRRSVDVVRKRWGEGITGSTAIGGIFLLVIVAAIVPAVAGFALLGSATVVGVLLLVVAAAIVATGMVVNIAVSQLFRFVLYEYATTDRALGPFSSDELASALQPKRKLLGRS